MATKITRTWGFDEDIVRKLDDWAAKAHLPLGYSVQLGVWMLMSANPDQRQMLLELMDERKDVQLNITVEPSRPGTKRKTSSGG